LVPFRSNIDLLVDDAFIRAVEDILLGVARGNGKRRGLGGACFSRDDYVAKRIIRVRILLLLWCDAFAVP